MSLRILQQPNFMLAINSDQVRGFVRLSAEPCRACLGWKVPIDRC